MQKIKPVGKPQRIACPNCTATFNPDKASVLRSPEQHRRFFGLVRAAFHHWPESQEIQFSDENDCRRWLTMKAGYRNLVLQMPMTGIKPDVAAMVVSTALKAADARAFVSSHQGQLVVWTPKSIRFDKMKHLEFCTLNNAVEDVIKDVFGMTGDELLERSEEAA